MGTEEVRLEEWEESFLRRRRRSRDYWADKWSLTPIDDFCL